MPTRELAERTRAIRARLDAPDRDIEGLHDAVQNLIDDLERHRDIVPADLREAAEALEAEIVEAFHDNLPV